MKNKWRIVVWVALIGVIGWALYFLWKDSCGCSTLSFGTLLEWIGLPLGVTALDGAVIGVAAWKVTASWSEIRATAARVPCQKRPALSVTEAAGVGLVIGASCFCLISAKAVNPNRESWWVERYKRDPIKSDIREIAEAIRKGAQPGRAYDSTREELSEAILENRPIALADAGKLNRKLTTLFKKGVDGCFLMRSLGRMPADESDLLGSYLSVTVRDLMDIEDLTASTRAMNALWKVTPTQPAADLIAKLIEFRYLSSSAVRRFREAASKVRAAANLSLLSPYGPSDVDEQFAGHSLRVVSLLAKQSQLIGQVKAILDRLATEGALDDPRFIEQFSGGSELSKVYHLAQVHSTAQDVSDAMAIAHTATYQLAILRELDRLKPKYLVIEGNPLKKCSSGESPLISASSASPAKAAGNNEKILRHDVALLFGEKLPSSVSSLSPDQIAYLFLEGAGGLYQYLHPSETCVWPDLSIPELRYFNYVARASDRKYGDLERSAKNGDFEFERTLRESERILWDEDRITYAYREQRTAEAVRQILNLKEHSAIAVLMGMGHNLAPAFDRIRDDGLTFQLIRVDWTQKGWFLSGGYSPPALATPTEQLLLAMHGQDFDVSQLRSFTDKEALKVALSKLAVAPWSLPQAIELARMEFHVSYPEAPAFIETVNTLLDERLEGTRRAH